MFDARNAPRGVNGGANKRAFITTAEYQLNPDGRCLVTELWPVLEGPDAPRTLVYHRPNATRTLSSESASIINADGFCPLRIDDRYMRFEMTTSLSASWSKWWGFKLTATRTGQR